MKLILVLLILSMLFIGAMWQDEIVTNVLIENDAWYDFPLQIVRIYNKGVMLWIIKEGFSIGWRVRHK